jgi:hypothetical protein
MIIYHNIVYMKADAELQPGASVQTSAMEVVHHLSMGKMSNLLLYQEVH